MLTGPRGLSYRNAATIIATQTGRSVQVRDLTLNQVTARYRAAGLPAEFASSLAATEDDVRAGRYEKVTTSVLDLTGRPPRTFEDFVREHATQWQPSGTVNDCCFTTGTGTGPGPPSAGRRRLALS